MGFPRPIRVSSWMPVACAQKPPYPRREHLLLAPREQVPLRICISIGMRPNHQSDMDSGPRVREIHLMAMRARALEPAPTSQSMRLVAMADIYYVQWCIIYRPGTCLRPRALYHAICPHGPLRARCGTVPPVPQRVRMLVLYAFHTPAGAGGVSLRAGGYIY